MPHPIGWHSQGASANTGVALTRRECKIPATAFPDDGDENRDGDQSETRSPTRNVAPPVAGRQGADPVSRHGLDVAKLVRHRVQSLRRNIPAEQRKLDTLLVRAMVEDNLAECGEFRHEPRMIHAEIV